MSRWRERLWAVVVVLVVGVVLFGAGLLVVRAGLDDADKIASVVGAAMGVLGVACSVWSVARARSLRAAPTPVVPAAEPAPGTVTLTAEATDHARVNQVGIGDMRVGD